MKYLFTAICLLTFIINYGQGQYEEDLELVDIPYYLPFENDNWNDNNFWSKEIENESRANVIYRDSEYSNVLRLTIQNGDVIKSDARDRSEIALFNSRHDMQNGDVYYYSWDRYFPKDIIEVEKGFENQYTNFIMQWHNDVSLNTSKNICANLDKNKVPPIMISMIPKTISPNSQPGKRDIKIKMGTGYGACSSYSGDLCVNDPLSVGQRIYNVKNAINLGEWNRFVMRIKWSMYSSEAEMYLWINEKPLNHIEEVSTNKCKIFNLSYNNTSNPAIKLGDVALLYHHKDNENKTLIERNYFKVGHYRNRIINDNYCYLDNFRITKEYPPKFKETFVINSQCYLEKNCIKSTNTKIVVEPNNYQIKAYEVKPALSYNFRFKSDDDEFVIGTFDNSINLQNYSRVKAGKEYEVKVKARNNPDFPYGRTKKLITPSTTYIKSNVNNTVNNPLNISSSYIDGSITCHPILQANKYKFKLTNVNNPNEVLFRDTELGKDEINLFEVWGIKENTKYKVEVKAKNMINGEDTYLNFTYGLPKYIRTSKVPTLTKLKAAYCNKTLDQSVVYCNKVSTAESYTFEFTNNQGNTFYAGSLSNSIDLANLNFFKYNTNYKIRVRAKNENQGYDYSGSCNVKLKFDLPLKSSKSVALNSNDLIVLQNRVKSQIEIRTASDVEQLKIYSISGKLIENKVNLAPGNYKINLDSYENQLIIIMYQKADHKIFKKIILQ